MNINKFCTFIFQTSIENSKIPSINKDDRGQTFLDLYVYVLVCSPIYLSLPSLKLAKYLSHSLFILIPLYVLPKSLFKLSTLWQSLS